MNLQDRIKEVDLRPSDIVKLQRDIRQGENPISLSQATGWIKNPFASKAVEQLLWRLCEEKVEQRIEFDKPGRKREVAGISSPTPAAPIPTPPAKKVKGSYAGKEVEFEEPAVRLEVDKSPRVVKAQVDDVPIATMGANNYDASQDMKFRIVGGIRKLVYNGKWWLVAADAERFSVMGRVFSASEFEGL